MQTRALHSCLSIVRRSLQSVLQSLAFVSVALGAPTHAAHGQYPPRSLPPVSTPLPRQRAAGASLLDDDDRSGPRVGAAYLIGGSVTAERAGRSLSPFVSLFGWQFEHPFDTGVRQSIVPMTELVVLAGGMEQGVVLPSVSWLLAARKPNGWEAAIGPTLTAAGVHLAVAAGVTHAFGNLNVPVNLAVAPGRRGASISVTTGFNAKRAQ
jgi:hypothetical protein